MARILCIVLLCLIWQCSDENNDPQSPTPELPPIEGKECPPLALYTFELNIQTAIDASCSGGDCHGSDADSPGGGLELIKRENEEDEDTATGNRANMISHRNRWLMDDGVLLDKITDDTHGDGLVGAGNQVAKGHITEEGIVAWLAAEKKCEKIKNSKNSENSENSDN